MKLSFVISSQPTRFQAVAFDPNLAANLTYLAELGYDGVELAVREPNKLDVPAVQSALKTLSLAVPAIGTGQAYVEEHLSFTDPDASVREQAIARVTSHIALAHELASISDGAPLVIVGLVRGRLSPNVAREQAYGWLVSAMQTVARTAAEENVRLAVEPINRYETDLINTVAETLALIKDIGASNVGILFDTFHANIEEPDIGTSLGDCRSRLFHVHVADSNRWYPGAGHTDFGAVIARLRKDMYTGWVSAEILPKPDLRGAAKETIQTLRRLIP